MLDKEELECLQDVLNDEEKREWLKLFLDVWLEE